MLKYREEEEPNTKPAPQRSKRMAIILARQRSKAVEVRGKLGYPVIAFLLLLSFFASSVFAQNGAQERAARLRSELAETQSQETEMQTRLQQLEEELKSENIERSLAGVGSTRPEDLRETRRRQLEIEKKSIESQLAVLTASRSRLEAAITRADHESYYESAGLSLLGQMRTSSEAPVGNRSRRLRRNRIKVRPVSSHSIQR
jgi:Skp family chaperone for outer membrane proteins